MVYKYSKAPSNRQLKVAQSIKKVISHSFIRNDYSHPFFEDYRIIIAEVKISADLKNATIFIVGIDGINEKELLKFLEGFNFLVRQTIAKEMNLRYAPEVRFAINKTNEVDKLLATIVN